MSTRLLCSQTPLGLDGRWGHTKTGAVEAHTPAWSLCLSLPEGGSARTLGGIHAQEPEVGVREASCTC